MPVRRRPRASRGPSAVVFIVLLLGAVAAGLGIIAVLDRKPKKQAEHLTWRPPTEESGGTRYVPPPPTPLASPDRSRSPEIEPEKADEATDEPVATVDVPRREPTPSRPTRDPAEEARRKADAAVLSVWKDLEREVAAMARDLRFVEAKERATEVLGRLKTARGRAVVEGRIEDLDRQTRLFERTVEALAGRLGKSVEIREGLEIDLTGVDAETIQGTKGPAAITMRWRDLSPEQLHDLVASVTDSTAEARLDLAALCFEHGLAEDAESHLRLAFRADPAGKPTVDSLLARWRGEAVPKDGYLVHDGLWIRPEEKDLLDRGFRKLDGRWVSEDEFMAARGYVRHEGEWITTAKRDRLVAEQQELDDLAKKHVPKGLIDEPGQGGEAVAWEDSWTVKSEHYQVRSNVSEQIANDTAFLMEALNWNFRRILGLGNKRMPRFEIQVCASMKEYRDILKGRGLGQAGSGGVIKTFYQPPRTTAVLMHEGVHQFVYKLAPTCPRWVHEGMATYFECSRFRFDERRRKAVLEVGLLNRHRLMGIQSEIRAEKHVPLEVFLQGRKGNPYTQGWSIIYYLAKAHDGKYAKRLLPFVEDAGKGSTLKRFKKAFGIRDIYKFEADWIEFVMGLDPKDGVDVFRPEGDGAWRPPAGQPGGDGEGR